jgi:hypothetical protein
LANILIRIIKSNLCDPFSHAPSLVQRSMEEGHGQIPLSVYFVDFIMIMNAHLGFFRDYENFKIPMGVSPQH